MADRTISRYRVLEQLGAGGMGEVYKAFDPKMQRDVALKILAATVVRDPERVQRFEVEALATSALNHPNITTIYEIDQADGQQFISLEFIDGSSLRELIRSGKLDLRQSIDIAAQIADGLHAAHEAGIVHRDLKPENIMVRHDGIAKILDFGLAKLRSPEVGRDIHQAETVLRPTSGFASPGSEALTRPGMVLGTVAYMSPEQARGQDVDQRSDIFSFGSILYEMLGGRQAFHAESSVEVLHAIIREPPPPLHELNARVPVELQRIVRKALAKNPGERYQTARDLAIDLRALELELQSGAVSAVRAPVRGNVFSRRGLGIVGIVGGIAVLAAAAVWFASRTDRKPAELPFRITKITASGQASSPILSPNGQFLAYESLVDARDAIFVRQLATGSEVEIVGPREGVALGCLSFTPDGNWFLYTVRLQGDAVRSLWQVSALGGTPREVLRDLAPSLSFAPDGTRFVFARDAGPGQTRFMTARLDAPSDIEDLYACPPEAAAISHPIWSPKGDVLAYVQVDKADVLRPKLMINEWARNAPRALAGPQWMQLGGLAWAHDGSGLYITGARSWIERPAIWFVDGVTGAARSLTQDLDSYSGISVSGDGKALASVRTTVLSQLYRVPLEGSPAESAARARQITRGTGLAGSPVVSPDGTKIAYISDAGGHMDIWTMDAAGTNARQITFGAAQDFAPVWSPDGTQIAFASETEGVLQVWTVDASGQNPRRLTSLGTTNHAPSWSPDGRSIAYISVEGDSSFLYRIPAAGGEAVRVHRDLQVMFTTQWSPDGRWIATWGNPGKPSAQYDVVCFPPAGGDVKKFTFTPKNQYTMLSLRWTPDSAALAYVVSEHGTRSIEILELETEDKRAVATFTGDETIFSQSWAPDGRSLIVQRGSVLSDVVMLEPKP